MKKVFVVTAALALLSMGCVVHADWTARSINPVGATSSYSSGGRNMYVAGSTVFDGQSHAGYWRGTGTGVWVDLHPSEATASGASYVFNSGVVGYATIDGYNHASLWKQTTPSAEPTWVDLHPSWAQESVALGLFPASGYPSAYSPVGYATIDGQATAVVWDARDNSCYILNGPQDSVARSIWRWTGAWTGPGPMPMPNPTPYIANIIVGSAADRGYPPVDPGNPAPLAIDKACYWILGAPDARAWYFGGFLSTEGVENASGSSEALSIWGNQIAGYITVGGANHASLWSGIGLVCKDLNPEGASSSKALATTGIAQIGYAEFDGASHAGYWNSTSGSWVDLHNALDPNIYSYSEATGGIVYTSGTGIVTGWAYNTVQGCTEAIAWTTSTVVPDLPEPSSILALIMGLSAMGGVVLRKHK